MKIIDKENLKIKTPKLSQQESQIIWQRVFERIDQGESQPRRWQIVFSRQAFAAVMVLAIFMFGTFGTAALASSSHPGDLFYPLKLTYENIVLNLAFNPQQKAKLAVKFSNERLSEIDQLLKLETFIKPTSVTPSPTSTVATSSSAHKETDKKEIKKPIENLEKNHQALIGALDYLETTKANLDSSGDQENLSKIDEIVEKLSTKTKDYINNLEQIKSNISDDQTKEKIDQTEERLKERFNLGGHVKGVQYSSNEILKNNSNNSAEKIRIKNSNKSAE